MTINKKLLRFIVILICWLFWIILIRFLLAYRIDLNDHEYLYQYCNATPNPLTAIGLLGRIDAILKR